MPDSLEPLAGSESRPLAVAEVETELSRLWGSMAGDASSPQAVTRACAMTLLVYVEGEQGAPEVHTLLAELTRQNPCRAIIVMAEPEAQPSGASAWISVHCHTPTSSEKQVCCEQISLRACGQAVHDMDKLVLPLTVSGLPVYLWWRAGRLDPLESFAQILRISNRVLVDSARYPHSEADLASLARSVESLSPRVLFSDLNWTRLTPWRDLTAQFFDSPEIHPYLDDLREVNIAFEDRSARRRAQETQALLYSGWLASRLGWKAIGREAKDGEKGSHFRLRSGRGQVQIECAPRNFEGSGSGVCFSIRLTSGHPPAVFSLARGKDGKSVTACAEIPGRPPISRAVRLEVLREVEIVNQELLFAGRDRVYEEALAAVARMVGD